MFHGMKIQSDSFSLLVRVLGMLFKSKMNSFEHTKIPVIVFFEIYFKRCFEILSLVFYVFMLLNKTWKNKKMNIGNLLLLLSH